MFFQSYIDSYEQMLLNGHLGFALIKMQNSFETSGTTRILLNTILVLIITCVYVTSKL